MTLVRRLQFIQQWMQFFFQVSWCVFVFHILCNQHFALLHSAFTVPHSQHQNLEIATFNLCLQVLAGVQS